MKLGHSGWKKIKSWGCFNLLYSWTAFKCFAAIGALPFKNSLFTCISQWNWYLLGKERISCLQYSGPENITHAPGQASCSGVVGQCKADSEFIFVCFCLVLVSFVLLGCFLLVWQFFFVFVFYFARERERIWSYRARAVKRICAKLGDRREYENILHGKRF